MMIMMMTMMEGTWHPPSSPCDDHDDEEDDHDDNDDNVDDNDDDNDDDDDDNDDDDDRRQVEPTKSS